MKDYLIIHTLNGSRRVIKCVKAHEWYVKTLVIDLQKKVKDGTISYELA